MNRLRIVLVAALLATALTPASQAAPSKPLELAKIGFKLEGVPDDGAGFWVEVGDFDGDGIADLAVGAMCEDTNGPAAGAVYLLYGPITPDRSLADADATLLGARPGDFVGEIMTVADIDGDGADELIVIAPGPFVGGGPIPDGCAFIGPVQAGTNRPGEVYIIRGGQRLSGVHNAADLADTVVIGLGAAEFTGFGIGSGDLDGDGNAELIVGASGPGAGPGQAFVFAGGALPSGTTLDADAQIIGEAPADAFSLRIASGDLTGDGVDDLVIAAPVPLGQPGRTSTVYVFLGGSMPSGLITAADADLILEGGSGDQAGRGLAVGDLDGDGVDDIIVGARGSGITYVFYGPVTGSGRVPLGEADIVVTGAPGTQAGQAVTAVNLDGEDRSDLVIGAPLDATGGELAGAVHRLNGPLSGQIDATTTGFLLVGEPGDMAGFDFAVGDVTGNGYDDLVVAAPGLQTPGRPGAVYIIPGEPA